MERLLGFDFTKDWDKLLELLSQSEASRIQGRSHTSFELGALNKYYMINVELGASNLVLKIIVGASKPNKPFLP